MEYRLGNSTTIHEVGKSRILVCLKCQQEVRMSVYRNKDTRGEASFPFLNIKRVYFAVCPNCASVFSLPLANGKAFENGDNNAVRSVDLGELKGFKL